MRVYSVHTRRGGLDPDSDIVLIKEGFCWPAALFGPVWAAWHGLWIPTAILTVTIVGLSTILGFFDLGDATPLWLIGGIVAGTGFVGNDLRRTRLARRGFVLEDVVVAADRDGAEHRFFDRHPVLAADVVGVTEVSMS